MLYLLALFVYFMDTYSKLTFILSVLFVLTIVFYAFITIRVILGTIDTYTFDEEATVKYKQKFKNIVNKWTVVITVLAILLPNPKTIYISSGLILGQQIVNKAENSTLLNKTYKVLETQMDKYLDEYLNEEQQTK